MRRAAIKSALIVAALAFCSPVLEANVARQHAVLPARMVSPAHSAIAVRSALRAPLAGRATHRQLPGVTPTDPHPFTTEFFFADRPRPKSGAAQAHLARD